MKSYDLIYEDFCRWLLEIIESNYQQPISPQTYNEIIALIEDNLRILHPFTPFASEELWQCHRDRQPVDVLS